MKTLSIRPTFTRVRERYAALESRVERLRERLPFLPRARVLLSIAALLAIASLLYGAFKTVLAPKETFTDFALPYVQNFDEVNLRRWFKHEGVWTLRQGALAQTVGGEHAAHLHIPYRVLADKPYHVSVYVTLKKDTRAAGISFNAQYPDMIEQQHRVFIARPSKERLELVSGYMDDAGSFVPQAQVPLDVNTTEYRIDVFVYDKTYLVLLNGQRLIEKRPLTYSSGLIGFYALGPATFDTLKLTAADNPNPGDMVYTSDFDQEPGGAGWVPFNGTWRIADQAMSQSDLNVIDAGVGYESSTFQNFTLRATLHHTAGVGAGVLFNMPSPYQLNGAHVLRFSDETDAIIWGYYDGQGNLVRQGYKDVKPPGNEAYMFQVFSGENSYDIYLGESLLARNVPLTSTQGHVGLVTSRAAASFSQVEVYPLFGANSGAKNQQLTPVAPKPTLIPGVSDGTVSVSPTLKSAVTVTRTGRITATAVAPKPTRLAADAPQATVVVAGTRTGAGRQIVMTATPEPAVTEAAGDGGSGMIVATRFANVTTAPPGDGRYTSEFTGKVSEQGWRANSGQWSFAEGKFVQSNAEGFDSSAVYARETFKDFSLSATFAHDEGAGAGILFNMPDKGQLAGAQMVRYSERRSNAIIWGYYDETGRFKGQGFADVEPASTTKHTIRVVASGSKYDIYLDDKPVVSDLPLQSESGYIGLITVRSSATFESVTVDGATAKPRDVTTVSDGFTDLRVLNGTWNNGGGVFRQTVPNLADYLVNTGAAGSVFTAEVKITLSNTPDVGGGLIFHMGDRGGKKNAYVVRLRDGGKGIWWGSTDETGKFKGQGLATLTDAGKSFVLKVVVNFDRARILVNNKEIVDDVSLNRQDGWIGLLAYGGPVTFENLKISLEQ